MQNIKEIVITTQDENQEINEKVREISSDKI